MTTRFDRRVAAVFAIATLLARSSAAAEPHTTDGAPATTPAPDGDPLDALRNRFRDGMDRYKAGAYADAIVIWESIYRELGADQGYRLAFDLGRAYEALGDSIKAAEHYETYRIRVAARLKGGETLEPNVIAQDEDARTRLANIAVHKGRIHVVGAERDVVVQVDRGARRVGDFTVYVEPGTHTVVFGGGLDADVRELVVHEGELADVIPPRVTPPPDPRWETRTERPFQPFLLWIASGLAVASLVVPVITYGNALAVKDRYDRSTNLDERTRLEAEYESARSNAYVSVALPAALTAAVGALAIWYVVGATKTRVPAAATLAVRASAVTSTAMFTF